MMEVQDKVEGARHATVVVDVQRSIFVWIYGEVEHCDATLECFPFLDSCAIILLRRKHSRSVLLPGVKIGIVDGNTDGLL